MHCQKNFVDFLNHIRYYVSRMCKVPTYKERPTVFSCILTVRAWCPLV